LFLSGCATVKEWGKGFMGVSTKVLEDERPHALSKVFVLGYEDSYNKIKETLKKQDIYIYEDNVEKRMLAVYLSATDTTPVGIFFSEEEGANTLIEISSPSTYAKEQMAKKIFDNMKEYIKPKPVPVVVDSDAGEQAQTEK
jgi:hypothetical protein